MTLTNFIHLLVTEKNSSTAECYHQFILKRNVFNWNVGHTEQKKQLKHAIKVTMGVSRKNQEV